MMPPMGNDGNREASSRRAGIIAAVGCYVMWGVFPLYWKLLEGVSSVEIICHRIVWCCVFTLAICAIARLDFVSLLKERRARHYLIPAAAFITINWSVYIFAVEIDHIVETAIGYYLNPLVSILLGIVVFKERLSTLQVIAVILCSVGICSFAVGYGQFPFIAIVLAVSFGIYGAIKKKGGYPAIEALAFENLVAVLPAVLIAVGLAAFTGNQGFLGDTSTLAGWKITLLLVFGGVITALPLILFARAANLVPLSLLGFIQYLSPTIALLIGVFVNNEPFTPAHAICLGCIWAGLALVFVDGMRASRRRS